MQSMGYFIGIGSNIDPQKNVVAVIDLLLQRHQPLAVSSVIETTPVGMPSDATFLNGVIYFETTLLQQQLKHNLNNIEQQLGRDRTDPLKKVKDRTADLDILLVITAGALVTPQQLPQESYLRDPFIELAMGLQMVAEPQLQPALSGICLQLEDITFGEGACWLKRQQGGTTSCDRLHTLRVE